MSWGRVRNINKLKGKWGKFHMRMTGFLPGGVINESLARRLMIEFLTDLAVPKNSAQRCELQGVFPSIVVVRCVAYDLMPHEHSTTFEFSPLAYRMCDARTGEPQGHRSRKQMEHYKNGRYTFVHEAQLIYPVPPEEFAQWPVVREIQIDAYKRFTINQGRKVPPAIAVNGDVITGDLFSSIRGYHTTRNDGYVKLGEINSLYPTFGCEIELVPTRAYYEAHASAMQKMATHILLDCSDIIDIELDGSVSRGFEIVSGYGHFDALDAAMRRLYKLHIEKKTLHTTRSTGLHFHVGWDKIDKTFLAKLYTFVSKYRQIVVVVAGREPNRFCRINSIKVDKLPRGDAEVPQWAGARLPVDRYNAINTQRWDCYDIPRFEWRSPKATTSYAAWRGRLEFIYHLTMWLKATDDEGIPAMEDFLLYLKRRDPIVTVGLRRILCSSVGQTALENLHLSRTQLRYNSRIDYSLLRL